MFLKKIVLTNFRNYTSEKFTFSERVNCVTGLNGMGKTNLLDAVFYLCMTKSNSGTADRNMMRHGADFLRLEGHFVKHDTQEKIEAKVIPSKRKTFLRNHIPYKKLTEHIGLLPVVFIGPEATELATGGSEIRRRFIDVTLSQTDAIYLRDLMTYNKILKQRNAALKGFSLHRYYDKNLIEALDRQLVQPAERVFTARKQFLEAFQPIFQKYYGIIADDGEKVSCDYQSSLHDDTLTGLLQKAIEKDRVLQRSTVGIHKDDLVFKLNDHRIKRFASQGQLKSFVLAMKLAQHEILKKEKQISPILLLDDIFDKLDSNRVEKLLTLLANGDYGQIFISDTHPKRINTILQSLDVGFKSFVIHQGKEL